MVVKYDDDMYVDEVSVCLCVAKNEHFLLGVSYILAPRSRPLGLAGCWPALFGLYDEDILISATSKQGNERL